MRKLTVGLVCLFASIYLIGQTALNAPLPEKFKDLKEIILVDNFPNPVKATTYESEPNKYYWKHTTTLLSNHENITIEEGGAYLFYNKQWNLRAAYPQGKRTSAP